MFMIGLLRLKYYLDDSEFESCDVTQCIIRLRHLSEHNRSYPDKQLFAVTFSAVAWQYLAAPELTNVSPKAFGQFLPNHP